MTAQLPVFVSSVQKELEDERLIVQNLINTDAFLAAHCAPVLYELEPASPEKALEGCLAALDECQVYLLIVGSEYGTRIGDLSITHAEYRRAKKRELPILAFIKGDRRLVREEGTRGLLEELEADGPKYKRFGNVIELQKEVRAALVKLLEKRFSIAPTSAENEIAEHTIEATSPFESQPLSRVRWQDLDHGVVRWLVSMADDRAPGRLSMEDLLKSAVLRGLVWQDSASGDHYATAAGIVLLTKDPFRVAASRPRTSALGPKRTATARRYRTGLPAGQRPSSAPRERTRACSPRRSDSAPTARSGAGCLSALPSEPVSLDAGARERHLRSRVWAQSVRANHLDPSVTLSASSRSNHREPSLPSKSSPRVLVNLLSRPWPTDAISG